MSASSTVEPLSATPTDAARLFGADWTSTLSVAHRWMTLGRVYDARMQALQRQGRIGFYGASTGQEAVNVATGLVSRPEDWIFPGLREQLVALVRGYSLTEYTHSIFADALDPAHGRQMPCHPTARRAHHISMSSVIGTQISQAVGLAYGMKLKHDPGVALAFFGDGATSANDFHAGLNFAGVFELPVLFGCANNQWAISVPVAHQTAAKSLAAKGAAYGIPGRQVDGTDFFAVYGALSDSLARIRAGNGPQLLEFLTYRMTPHTSSDDPTRYQPGDWAERGQRHDPYVRLTEWMRRHGLLTPEREAEEQARADADVREAVAAAEAAPPPALETLTEDVYSPRSSAHRGATQ